MLSIAGTAKAPFRSRRDPFWAQIPRLRERTQARNEASERRTQCGFTTAGLLWADDVRKLGREHPTAGAGQKRRLRWLRLAAAWLWLEEETTYGSSPARTGNSRAPGKSWSAS